MTITSPRSAPRRARTKRTVALAVAIGALAGALVPTAGAARGPQRPSVGGDHHGSARPGAHGPSHPAGGHAPGAWAAAVQPGAQAIVDGGSPGVIVLASNRGRTQRLALGSSRLDPPRALTPADSFRAGSTSKTITAATVVTLARQHRLGLDDTVARWLPGLASDGTNFTIRQLLNQTSGLAEYATDPRVITPFERDPAYVWPLRALATLALDRPRVAAPGTRWSYSNANYVLLGLVIEAVTHRPWQEAEQQLVLRPLGLRSSGFPSGVTFPDGFAHGFIANPDPAASGLADVSAVGTSFVASAGMLVTTADDLARLYGGLLVGRVVGRTGLAEMQQVPAVPGEVADYGLGLFKIETACGDAWGHDGELLGTTTLAFASPGGTRQAVVMVNRGQPTAAQSQARIALLERAFCAA